MYLAFKPLLFVFIFSVFSMQRIPNKVGEVKDNRLIITANTHQLKSDCDQMLADHGISAVIASFEILKDHDTSQKPKKYYFLVGYSENKQVKVATLLVRKGNSFYFPNLKEQRFSICYGTQDCMPKIFKNNQWGCDCAQESLFDCKKKEVILFR